MNIYKTYLSVFIFLVTSVEVSAQGIKAGAAAVDMTPPLEMKFALGGYGDRMSKPAEGVHDRIWAKAVVLQKGDKKYVIVTLDVLALPPNVKPELLERISSAGWNKENVMLLASHSHASFDMTALNDKNHLGSPQIGIYQPELLQHVLNVLEKVITEAGRDLQQVKVGTGSMVVEGMNHNRRGDPDVDRNLTVTRIDLMTGKPLAVLVNWTAHPTFMSDVDMWVSGGWPGYLQRELQQCIGDDVVALYYNGAEADLSVNGPSGVKSHYEKAEIYGRAIAIKAMDVYRKIKLQKDVVFEYDLHEVSLPDRKVHPLFMETGGKEYNLTPEVLDAMSPEATSVGALRLGDMLLVGAPGELAAGLGLQIKSELKAKGIKYPVIGGLSNEWISYILSAEQYNNGAGYESSVSFYGETLGEVIVNAMLEAAIPLAK